MNATAKITTGFKHNVVVQFLIERVAFSALSAMIVYAGYRMFLL